MLNSFKVIAAALTLGASVVGASSAKADPISFFYSFTGTAGSYVQFGSTQDGANIGVNGSANVTNAGTTFAISAGATGSPLLPEPKFNTSTLSVTTAGGGGTIYLAVVESGLTATNFTAFNIGFTNNNSDIPVTESFYTLNAAGTVSTFVAGSTMDPNKASVATYLAPTLTSPYGITELYKATFTGSGQTLTATINESAVPEPMSIALLGTALVGAGMLRRKRNS